MRRATITLPESLDRAVEEFRAAQPARPSLTSVVEAALEAYLTSPSTAPTGRLTRIAQSRADIVDAARERGAVRIGVFGSVAEGRDGPESDVDFWVETGTETSLFDLMALRAELQKLLGERVDLLTLGGLDSADREDLVSRSLVL